MKSMNIKKVVIVLYASNMTSLKDQNFNIQAEDIEPFILYGVKVITKQQVKMVKKKRSDALDY